MSGAAHLGPMQAWFAFTTRYPRSVLLVSLLLLVGLAFGLKGLVKDTSVEAFIPSDHPSVSVRDNAQSLFGLRDPIVVALMTKTVDGIYDPARLRRLKQLHRRIESHPNIRADRVMSLASESSIRGSEDSIEIEQYLLELPRDTSEALAVKQRVQAMPPHMGTLVAKDGSAALIVAELIDDDLADQTYQDILALTEALSYPEVSFHVAGQGAVAGHLSGYIDTDYRRLQPLVFGTILLVLFLAFFKLRALLAPLLVIAGSTAGALGAMGWLNVAYYPITSALPIVLVGISVADAIHVLTRYYELRAQDQVSASRQLIILTMDDMWKPITLTTITTAAGFLGIAYASIMPPISYFGWFATLGVLLAWIYTIAAVPAVMTLIDPGQSVAFRNWPPHGQGDWLGRGLTRLALFAAQRPTPILLCFVTLAIVASLGAQQLRIDRSQIDNFVSTEPIYQAHQAINEKFAGTSYLDVVVETDAPGGLLEARRMAKLVALQDFMRNLPHLQQTTAIADYLQLLHRALHGTMGLPIDEASLSQYLLVYESSGDPTDLAEEIDADYRFALVRGMMNSSLFSEEREAAEALAHYVATEFNEPGMRGALSGRVNVDYHWMTRLGDSHFYSVAISLTLALIATIVLFHGVVAGLLAMLPVCFSILCLYGVMGYRGIYLEPATSMFAAIAVGLGIDFAIHLVTRIRQGVDSEGSTLQQTIEVYFPAAARACCFSLAALAMGFGVLLLSELATLQRFGALVAIAAISSFLTALLIVPAAYSVWPRATRLANTAARSALGVICIILAVALAFYRQPVAHAEEDLGQQIAQKVFDRPAGKQVRREINMELVDKRGKVRRRDAVSYRADNGQTRRAAIFYTSPKMIRETAFLSHDHAGAADDRWLYLPAARKVRRIPASDRGDYFLGTDFTYEDINSQLKFSLEDYRFRYVEARRKDGRVQHVIAAEPVSQQVAAELGYGGFLATVDEHTWIPVSIQFKDPKQHKLKTITVDAIDLIDTIWTPLRIKVENHQTGHSTVFHYKKVQYRDDLDLALFEPDNLKRGLPD